MNDDAATLIGREWAAFLELLDGASWDAPTRLQGVDGRGSRHARALGA
ncbi:hypothetical protein [Georgenia sp. SUBG003]